MSETQTARSVSLAVAIDGQTLVGVERLDLMQGGSFSAARFRVVLAVDAMAGGAEFYAGLMGGTITIGIGIGASGMSVGPILTGQLDNVTIDFARGQVLLAGRDLSARLIDAEVEQSFSNQTSSQIAAGFAQDAGLAANIQATHTPVGQYYELAHARTGLALHARHATRWDLLASLATIERFSLSVTGTTLNFGPVATVAPVVLTFGRDFISLAADRALGLVAPRVVAKSWNPKLKQSFVASAGSAGGVTLIRPNLTQAEVSQLAAARQAELAGQAVLLRASMPGELSLLPGGSILLQGTVTGLDGPYVIRTIERSVAMQDGFIQRFEAVQAL